MIAKRIIIVEKDRIISSLLRFNLERAGLSCNIFHSKEEIFLAVKSKKADLIILNPKHPDIDGHKFCLDFKLMKKSKQIPILIISPDKELIEKMMLDYCVEDYMLTPINQWECVMRVRAMLRRHINSGKEETKSIKVDHLKVDIPKHKVYTANKEVSLTGLEFKLLVYLAKKRGQAFSREDLLRDVWGLQGHIETRTIDTHVKQLRKKLGTSQDLIETVRGKGYRIRE